MKWFDQWFAKQAKKAWEASREEKIQYNTDVKMNVIGGKYAIAPTSGRSLDVQPTLNFRLHHAENGWIVEVTCHDTRTDRHTTRMHLIGDDQEFDQAICQIITLEALRG